MSIRSLILAAVALTATPSLAEAAPRDFRCGTPDLLPTLRDVQVAPRHAQGATALGGRALRNNFSGTWQTRESERFAVRWQNAPVTEAQAQLVLDTAEQAATLFESLGHGILTGNNQYKMNIYLALPESSEDYPYIDWAGGYATVDDAGYTFQVTSYEMFAENDDAVRHVVSHELYHNYQFSSGNNWGTASDWFWEGTADWGAQEFLPDQERPYNFVGAYALKPELSLFYFGDPFSQDVDGAHQYGTSIWHRFVTDSAEDSTIIPRAWEQGSSNDPIVAVAALVDDLPATFGSFAAHNALWDYPQRDLVMPAIDGYENFYPDESAVALSIGGEGTGSTPVSPPSTEALHAWGYNIIELRRPSDGVFDIEVATQASGTQGGAADWHITMVRDTRDGIVYEPMAVTDGVASTQLTMPLGDRAYLAVAVTSASRSPTETFAYTVSATIPDGDPEPEPEPEPDPDDMEEDPPGCCSAGNGGATGPAALALLLGALLRRRRRA